MDKRGDARRGLIGFFDLLGYKSIMENNNISEAILIVKKIQQTIEEQHKKLIATERFLGQAICDYVVFSDSILVYTTFPESEEKRHRQIAGFAEFCAGLINDLFWAGLPARGAWAFGAFYVDLQPGKICLAGMPIVEAYQLSDRVDMIGCVFAPSAVKVLTKMGIIDPTSELPIGFIQYPVPLKDRRNKGTQKQQLFMLNHCGFWRHYHPEREISREAVMERFAAHKKRVGDEVLSKVDNTLEFFEASKPS
jgi:hypothetical protein